MSEKPSLHAVFNSFFLSPFILIYSVYLRLETERTEGRGKVSLGCTEVTVSQERGAVGT